MESSATNGTEKTLSRQLSPLNVWALALGCVIGWGAFVMPGNTFLPKAGPAGTAIAMLLAGVVMSIIAFNYDYMINKHPQSGGEFIYTQKCFGSTHAFICSWFLGLSYLAIVPLNATALALIGRNLLHSVFQFGFHYVVAGYDIYFGELLLAEVSLVLFAYLSIRGVKFTGAFQTILVFALVAGVLVVSIAAFCRGDFKMFHLQPAFSPTTGRLAGVLAVIAVAPWAFVGFDTVPQAAEEFNFSPTKSKSIMVLSILFGVFVYVILNTVTASVHPTQFQSWADYIANLNKTNGLESLPTFYAAHKLLGNLGLIFLGIAVLAAILSGLVGFYMASSRLLFSMSCEKVLPACFSTLHKKYQTPVYAILFILFISCIAPFFGRTALGWIVDMSSLGAAIGYGYTSAAALKYALKEKDGFIIFTGVLGIIFSLIFMVLLLVPIKMFHCSLGQESYICLVIWIALGIFFYVFSKRTRNAK